MKPSLRKINESVSNFIQKTYEILENTENTSIICWSWKGCSFIIRDVKFFQTLILPKYFKHSNFSSFVRQLNMYNFHKVRGDKHDNQFQHPKFKKGHRELLCKIKRKQNDLPILTMEPFEKPITPPNDSQQSIDEQIEENAIKEEQQAKFPNEIDTTKEVLEKLQLQNKLLKKTKFKQQAQLKYHNSNNLNYVSQKFYKLIVSLLAVKIRNQSQNQPQLPKSEHQSEDKKWPVNFDELLQHIIGIEQPLGFEQYQVCAKKLFQKHNDQFFMLKKVAKEAE